MDYSFGYFHLLYQNNLKHKVAKTTNMLVDDDTHVVTSSILRCTCLARSMCVYVFIRVTVCVYVFTRNTTSTYHFSYNRKSKAREVFCFSLAEMRIPCVFAKKHQEKGRMIEVSVRFAGSLSSTSRTHEYRID